MDACERPDAVMWESSFERDTFTVAFGDFARQLLPELLARDRVRRRYESCRTNRILAEFDLGPWGEMAVIALGDRDRFVVHIEHHEFAVVGQVACDGESYEALRIADFRGELASALAWCRAMWGGARVPNNPLRRPPSPLQ